MSKQYKTPGVYVVEKDAFGSSIVANATAVPIFIGFTEKADFPNGEALPNFKIPGQTHPDKARTKIPYLINSMLEYTQCFGGPDTTGTIEVNETRQAPRQYFTADITKGTDNDGKGIKYQPAYTQPAVANYFTNGGGSCYILSLGSYIDFNKDDTGAVNLGIILKAIEEAEQCTLIIPIDLIRYGTSNYYNWANQFLDHAFESKEQFCVLDVIMSNPKNSILDLEDVDKYRSGVTSENLKYAGAYYPYMKSLTSYAYDENRVTFKGTILKGYSTEQFLYYGNLSKEKNVYIDFTLQVPEDTRKPDIDIKPAAGKAPTSITVTDDKVEILIKPQGQTDTMELTNLWEVIADKKGYDVKFLKELDAASIPDTKTFKEGNLWRSEGKPEEPIIIQRASGLASNVPGVESEVVINGTAVSMKLAIGGQNNKQKLTINCPPTTTANNLLNLIAVYLNTTDDAETQEIKKANFQFFENKNRTGNAVGPLTFNLEKHLVPNNAKINEVRSFLATNFINMPPSPFMAGIYSRLDNATGVWTPPANVAPNDISGPVVNLTNKQQEDFNIDAIAGKSINAIRSFTGKGTLVWGARTSDGNSMDWRYVNVVRLFISIETDISMALEAFVFKPNVFNTWVEVKTMIDSYLFGLFNQGAFAGTTPETSYQVQIGLGETMTNEDVLNGYMRATILIAPVRPTEFIVLTFSQMIGQ